MKIKKLLRYSGWTLLTVFILLNISAAFHAWRLTHFYGTGGQFVKPYRMGFTDKAQAMVLGVKIPHPQITTKFTLPHDTITLKTSGGLKIDSWYSRHRKSKGSVALFHGHLGNKGAITPEATAFHKLGYNVLLVDLRGHGNSQGNYCTIGFKEGEEVKLAVDYLKSKGEKNIILWGTSMGAAAITSAFKHHQIKPSAVILELPFNNLHSAVSARVKLMGLPKEPLSSILTFWGGVENGFNAFNFSPAEYAKTINCPVLVQAGKLDSRVSLHDIDELFKNIPSDKKQKQVYDNAHHQSLLNKNKELWINRINSFLGKVE
ncbi:MAG TPA: alpha/beta fold hydrolase [Bacteroidia bacterium]|nr:alpha/beta fold hydrolase [Bacteroidia bacterium]